MKLDDLLRTLAEDVRAPGPSLDSRMALAAFVGLLVPALLVLGLAGIRPDWPQAMASFEVQAKFSVAALLVGTGFLAARDAMHPTALSRSTLAMLALAPLAVGLAVMVELMTTPAPAWLPALLGAHPEMCVVMVPLLSLPALTGVLLAMRKGAPRDPSSAGALAGLCSGAQGAGAYMLHCTDDAPLFVMIWYGAAVLIVAGLGAVLGRKVLRW